MSIDYSKGLAISADWLSSHALPEETGNLPEKTDRKKTDRTMPRRSLSPYVPKVSSSRALSGCVHPSSPLREKRIPRDPKEDSSILYRRALQEAGLLYPPPPHITFKLYALSLAQV